MGKASSRHYWPSRLPRTLYYPQVPLFEMIETCARRYPNKPAIIYYGRELTYRELHESIERLSAALSSLGIKKGDRVATYLQNTPHYIISYYAIMRANAITVPVNPMLREEELKYVLNDSGARIVITTSDLYPVLQRVRQDTPVETVILGHYADYLPSKPKLPVPNFMLVKEEYDETLAWTEVLSAARPKGPDVQVGPDDWALLPYTSATTGLPKGCIHTHSTILSTTVGSTLWFPQTVSTVHLVSLPLFHVSGMQHSMNGPLNVGATLVLLTRWDREAAVEAIEKYRCTYWINITTMVVDLLALPEIERRDLSSLSLVGGGGAPLPEAVGERLYEITGLRYVEGYGLTETISQTHFNPPERPKFQCGGIAHFDTLAKLIHPETGEEVPEGQEGELVVSGPQVFRGYWNKPEETEKAFITIGNKRFFRTGDICRIDDEGYLFIVDRVKRMINAAGYKVWPTEVEGYLYKHPAILEVCVVGVPDPVRIENVKAFVVLRPEYEGRVTEKEIIEWSRERMAAYKYPRIVEFVRELPKSGTGKILWRVLQEQERKRLAPPGQ